MASQGGQEQQESSDICLAVDRAKMSKGGFSCAGMKETQQVIEKSCAQVLQDNMRVVEFPQDHQVNAAIERHHTMVYTNQMDGCLPWPYGTAKNP